MAAPAGLTRPTSWIDDFYLAVMKKERDQYLKRQTNIRLNAGGIVTALLQVLTRDAPPVW
jgi:hypothetical protein